jgi:hypothetical protein
VTLAASLSDARLAAEHDLRALDRRGFLRLAGLAAATGLLPTGCGDVPRKFAPPPGLELEFLTPRSFAVLTAATARVAGPAGAEQIARGELQPGRAAESFLAGAPDLAGPLGQALLALEFGFWPLLGKLRPFTGLSDSGRDRVLHELMASHLGLKRLAFNGIRSVALLCFYGSLAEGRPAGFGLGEIPPDVSIAQAMAE